MDVGVLRALEPIAALTPDIPECAFVHVVRRALPGETGALPAKRRDELRILAVAQTLQGKRAKGPLAGLVVRDAEFQFDRKKLLLFCDLLHWVHFNEFVKAVRGRVEDMWGYKPRIFIQRRFVKELVE